MVPVKNILLVQNEESLLQMVHDFFKMHISIWGIRAKPRRKSSDGSGCKVQSGESVLQMVRDAKCSLKKVFFRWFGMQSAV